MSQTSRRAGVHIKTFGCQMNHYDSEKMFSLLAGDFAPATTAEEAELVIVNTCSVREKGEHKLFSLLGTLRDMKAERPELIIGVTGCVAQQEGKKILQREQSVDFVVGTHNLSLVPSLVRGAQEGLRHQVAVDYREDWENLPLVDESDFASNEPAWGGVRALVAIQRGCNKNCAFCVVPNTRGPEVSRSPDEILREIALKARLGAKEVLLLGQTVNSYGRDLSPRWSFPQLIRRVAEIPGVERIRFTSPHPAEVREDFLELFASVPQLMPHIHLPLQSGSDRILKLMNRNYRTKRYLEIVDSLRSTVPQIAITTDIIVGFPTETEEDFLASLDLMRKVNYHHSYSFKYSVRPGTKAESAFTDPEHVPEPVASERLLRLQHLQEELSLGHNQALLGQPVEILVEGMSKNISSLAKGRTRENIQAEVIGDVRVGEIVTGTVEFTAAYGIRTRLVSDSAVLMTSHPATSNQTQHKQVVTA